MSVERSEWKAVWLGTMDTPAEEGWLPTSDLSVAQLAVFDQKVTVGDATKDTDPFISSWIQGDFSGGGQIEEINEGTDGNRFWWSCADTRFPNHVTLPPLVTEAKPSGTWQKAMVLGDVYSTGGVRTSVACAFDSGSGVDVYLWNEGNDDIGGTAAATKLYAMAGMTGFWRGVSFQGRAGSYPLLYVPQGDAGYCTVHDNAGTPAVTRVASSATVPKAICFCTYNDVLYALDQAGTLWSSVDGDGSDWAFETTPLNDPLRINPSEEPRGIVSFFNKNGDPTLCLISSAAVYMWDQDAFALEQTTLQAYGHFDFGRHATVFRPGEDLWISDGVNTIRYTSAGVIVPNVGAGRDDGLPGILRSRVSGFAGTPSFLFSTMRGEVASVNRNALMCWTGTGWHSVWEKDATATGWMTYPHVSVVSGGYRVFWAQDDTVYTMRLCPCFFNPKQAFLLGTGEFAEEGYVESGRFDANMLGFRKLASHLVVAADNATPTEKVEVYYQTDADAALDPVDPAWTLLGTVTEPGLHALEFGTVADGAQTFSQGINFQWMRLKVKLYRGADDSQTPILNAWTLHYTKIPSNTASFSFKVPLPTRTWMGRTGDDIKNHLNALLVDDSFIKFVHGGTTYRVRVAGVSGIDMTGEDMSGVRQVTLMNVRTTV